MTEEEKLYLTLLGYDKTGIQIIKIQMQLHGLTMLEALNKTNWRDQ